MDHEKTEMKSEKEESENSRANDGDSDRPNIEEELIGTNPENESARVQQPFFVADTGELEDNESMIIPSSQAEDSELMIPSTPACADTSDRKLEDVDPSESTVSVLEETCIDLEEKAGPVESSKEFSNQAEGIETDMTQDLSELQPTQPIVTSNIDFDHPFNKSPVDTNPKKSEEDDDDSWHLKFSETQTQDLMNFQKDDQQDEEPEDETFKVPKKPEIEAEAEDYDDDDDLPATLSIEVPPCTNMEGDYYKMKEKESECNSKVDEVEMESDDEIEPSQSCLSEYKGETIGLSYKVQSNVDASNNEQFNEEIPKLSSEKVSKIDDDVDIIDSEKRTVNLTESESVNVLDEFKSALGDRTLSIEELPVDGVEENKEKEFKSALGDRTPSIEELPVDCVEENKEKEFKSALGDRTLSIEELPIDGVEENKEKVSPTVKKKTDDSEIVVKELVEEKPVKKSSVEYPLKFYDEEVVKIKEINGSKIEEITLSEVDKDEETVVQKTKEAKLINKDVLENSTEHSEKMLQDNLKLPHEVSLDHVEIENNKVENDFDGKDGKTATSILNKDSETETMEIDNSKEKSEVSEQDLKEKTEISVKNEIETQKKLDVKPDTDEKENDSEAVQSKEIISELDVSKLSDECLQQSNKQTTDEKTETPKKTFAVPAVPSNFSCLKKQKVQNTNICQEPLIVERPKKPVGSCKEIRSVEKFFTSKKSFSDLGIKLNREKMEMLVAKQNGEFKLRTVFTFTDQGIFLEEYSIGAGGIEIDHHHRDSGASPINSSSTATSSNFSSAKSMPSGDIADISNSLSSGKEMSANILSPQDITLSQDIPKTSTQKSPSDKNTSSKSKIDSDASPVVPQQPVTVSKGKRNRKNIQSSTIDVPVSNEPKGKKRKTKPKQKVVDEQSETDSSKDAAVEVKPRKPTRRKKEATIMPDIKPEDIKEFLDDLSIEDSSAQEEANFGSILPGVKVMARWKDGYYYCGMVQSQGMDGKWAVLFEDGFLRTISPECLIKVAILPKGTKVLVQSPDDFYDPGTVCGHFREGNKVGYEVELDSNGVTKRYPRSGVILSNDQAKLLMSNRPPTTPASMTINLDNIVDGKRKRKPVQSPSPAATSPVVKRVTRSKKPDSNLDTDLDFEAEIAEAVASSKRIHSESELPLPKRKKTSKKGSGVSESTSPMPPSSPETTASFKNKGSEITEILSKDSELAESTTSSKSKGSEITEILNKDSVIEESLTSSKSKEDEKPQKKTSKKGAGETATKDFEDEKPPSKKKKLSKKSAVDLTSTSNDSKSEDKKPPPKKKKLSKKGAGETSASPMPSTSAAVASTSTSNVSKSSRARRVVTLFKDYAFLLTNADRKVVPKTDTSDSDTVKEEEDIVPFDKDELQNHIASGGGLVLDKFDDIKLCTRKHIYLLANSYVRTMKYIQCIAGGISCIKHHWVQNCIFKSEILSLSSYILPAGYSIVTQQVIEWHGKTDVFEGCSIALVSSPDSPFVCTWAPVLLAAKANFVQKWNLPSSVSGSSLVVNVLVTNSHCPHDIIQSAKRRKIPIVSSEWIIQCLIMGERLPYDSHPKFKYTEV